MKPPALITHARWSLRLLALLWLAVGLLLALPGCGGSTSQADEEPTAEDTRVFTPHTPACTTNPRACQ